MQNKEIRKLKAACLRRGGLVAAVLAVAMAGVSSLFAEEEGFVDAANFGFSSAAEPTANAAALQKALDGGHRRVRVSKPGTYRLDRTVYVDDDTTLEFAKGVVLSKAVVYANVLANRSAFFGGRNRNIVIRGLNIATNGREALPPNDSRAAGLRGLIGFYGVDNLVLRDTAINDFGTRQYAVQIVDFDGLLIDGFELRGNKDGIHLNAGKNFVIRNGKLCTYDDGIAINAGEWPGGCTPLMGSITDGLIENVEDEPGGHCNFARVITGAWMEWHKGVPLQFRDIFTIGREVYSVYPGKVSTNEVVSLTPPSHTNGVWTSPEGINFFHCQSDGCRRADIRRVTFRNIRMNCERAISCSWELGAWARLIHPELPRADYPVIDIRLENVVKTAKGPVVCGNADADIIFEKCRSEQGPLATMKWSREYRTQCPVRRITVDGVTTVHSNGTCKVVSPRVASGSGKDRIPREIGGRKIDFWRQPLVCADGRSTNGLVLVKHPTAAHDGKGRPLYVVLHSAGHDALKALRCTADVHNHDIYSAPDDFFGLYLDCRSRPEDWWWGADRKMGLDEVDCERRVLATVREVIGRYDIDSNRVYLCGNSMGGSGTLGIGLRHGDVFAAIKANVPAIRRADHPFKALGLPPYALPAGARIPDPPVLVDYSAQNDGWSDNHDRLIRGMRERKYAWMLYWGAFGHADDDPIMLEKNDLIHSLDWLSIRLDEPYPVFTDASTDDVPPWTADRKDPRPGQVNGFFRWSGAGEDEHGAHITLSLDASLKSRHFTVPDSSVADVTLRRLRRFAVAPGDKVRWTFGSSSGEAVADAQGLITIPRLTVTKKPTELKVCASSKAKGRK